MSEQRVPSLPPPIPHPRLEMHGIQKRFGATIALAGVDLVVRAGEVHALVGENGAGKSTLMKILSGAYQADAGHMLLDGQPYAPRNPIAGRGSGVGMIYQELSLAADLNVAENILLGMEPRVGPFVRARQMRDTARQALEELDRTDIDPRTIVGRLSIADRQIVEIARAIAVGARVLVLDEPTSSLTRSGVERLFSVVRRLSSERGYSIIYISHFLEEVQALCSRFTVLRDGKTVGSGRVADTPSDRIIAMMVGREMKDLYPRSARRVGEIVLDATNMVSTRKSIVGRLELRRGEVLGIAGLVGAGRTELLRAIFGLDKSRGGVINLRGRTGSASPRLRWHQGAGMVSEDRKTEGLALSLDIASNLTLSRQPFIASPSSLRKMSRRWIERLAVKTRGPAQIIGDLSGGNQQKVAIARLLHHDVEIYLLDEPTRGIDVGSKAQIYQLIDELACSGKAIIMVSSYLPELLGVCDRVAVMSKGRLGPGRPVSEIDEHAIMREATQG
ncbi:MAG: sugar ABC transporter ATP-binding protein [Burkholderiales bacterium]|nr:sugar ABC transporter ATP-binding protein [Phycisphaerae bacterium]